MLTAAGEETYKLIFKEERNGTYSCECVGFISSVHVTDQQLKHYFKQNKNFVILNNTDNINW